MTIDELYQIISSEYAIAMLFSFTGSLLIEVSKLEKRKDKSFKKAMFNILLSTFAGANIGIILAGLVPSKMHGSFLIGGSGLLGTIGYKKAEKMFMDILKVLNNE